MSEQLDPLTGKVVGPRGAKAFKKWEPKKWLTVYESIVALSCTGLSNEEVGRRFGYGKQQVSNILNTEQGKALIKIINNRIREKNAASVGERLENMQERALVHLEAVLNREPEEFKNPLAIFDRSLALMKASGKFSDDSDRGNTINNIVQNNNIDKAMILSPAGTSTLREGLEKANQVKVIHDGAVGHNNTGLRELNGQCITEGSSK